MPYDNAAPLLKQRVLVLGGAGYIGSTLVPMLLDNGARVHVIDRFFFGENILPAHPRLTHARNDSRLLTTAEMQGFDTLIDLAAISNDPAADRFSELTRAINYTARVRNAELAKAAGIQRYLLSSSCSVYGFNPLPITELTPVNPLTTYARANAEAEYDLMQLSTRHFHVTALRLGTVFGHSPRMRADLVVNAMTWSACRHRQVSVSGSGQQSRPLVHVRDAAAAAIAAIQAPAVLVSGGIYNVAAENITIGEVAAQVCRHVSQALGEPVKENFEGQNDARSYRVSSDLITSTLQWHPRHSIEQGINELLDRISAGLDLEQPRHHTLRWYEELHRNPHHHPQVRLNGKMLHV
ncbi:NAD-dependent epimerase/dehydratase [Alcanivorax sp. S71-1-4]|jgi:nucleoside-diphosphate-sugar epimerase|uniref:NAD-dependent epimerase/dehydratase family protein n=1 Tax=Alcanivorax sp. S71-1-4 TaxID=1177159 RepID=UPI00135718F7|nr:SDR family oxidoreductase [Alcanivorax sp. S71-1-4]KAF0810540.1 NAD-dependent epimerase/dehydratase [Alcanivorax sp. S71-1-4]